MRNGFLQFPENRLFSAEFVFVSGFFVEKCHFGGHFTRFFGNFFVFFLVFGVLGLDGALQEVAILLFLCLANLLWPRCIASILHIFLRIIFAGLTNLNFWEVQIFDQIGFGRQKTAWGCRTEVVLKMTFSHFFWARTNLWNFWRAGVSRFGFESGPLPQLASRLRCGGFFPSFFRGSSFDTVFANI